MPNAYAAMLETLAGRQSRKVANNTYLHVADISSQTIAIRLHASDIITASPNGAVTINQCGWPTVTTRDRINAFFTTYRDNLPAFYGIGTKSKQTQLTRGAYYSHDCELLGTVPASGAVTIGPRGAVRGLETVQVSARAAKLRATIREYSRGLQAALPLSLPNNGDCMFCSMFDGRASAGKLPAHSSRDHLLSHLDESYYVPSLIWNALLYAGCTPNGAGSAYFAAAFSDSFAGYPRERVSTFVARYLERALQVS